MSTPNLDTLLSFEMVVDTPDDSGGYARTWEERCRAWAQVKPTAQGEAYLQGKVTARRGYKLTCRVPDVQNVTVVDRVTVNGDLCNVSAVCILNRAVWAEILVELGEAP